MLEALSAIFFKQAVFTIEQLRAKHASEKEVLQLRQQRIRETVSKHQQLREEKFFRKYKDQIKLNHLQNLHREQLSALETRQSLERNRLNERHVSERLLNGNKAPGFFRQILQHKIHKPKN